MDPGLHQDRWKDLQARERLVYLLLIGLIPVAGGLAFLIYQLYSAYLLAAAVPLAWVAALSAAWLRFTLFRCPGCGKLFHSAWTGSPTFGTKCAHCGLARGE